MHNYATEIWEIYALKYVSKFVKCTQLVHIKLPEVWFKESMWSSYEFHDVVDPPWFPTNQAFIV